MFQALALYVNYLAKREWFVDVPMTPSTLAHATLAPGYAPGAPHAVRVSRAISILSASIHHKHYQFYFLTGVFKLDLPINKVYQFPNIFIILCVTALCST